MAAYPSIYILSCFCNNRTPDFWLGTWPPEIKSTCADRCGNVTKSRLRRYKWKLGVQPLGSTLNYSGFNFPSLFPSCWVKLTVMCSALAAILNPEATLGMEDTVNEATR